MTTQPDIPTMKKNLWIIWGAFMFAPIIYVVISYTSLGGVQIQSDEPFSFLGEGGMFIMMLAFIGMTEAIVSLFVYLKILIAYVDDKETDLSSREGLSRYQMYCIICWAFSEGVAVLGVVAAMFSTWIIAIPFAIIGAVLLLMQMPKHADR